MRWVSNNGGVKFVWFMKTYKHRALSACDWRVDTLGKRSSMHYVVRRTLLGDLLILY